MTCNRLQNNFYFFLDKKCYVGYDVTMDDTKPNTKEDVMTSYECCPKCGDVFSEFTCKNGGPNHGRRFSKCKVHGFFAWLDNTGRRIVEEQKPKTESLT